MKKIFALLFLIFLSMFLSGCDLLGGAVELACGFNSDSSHCYQAAALQKGDVDTCDKVSAPEQYQDMGSNPPKDKCIIGVAQNKEDETLCNKVQGGFGSYSKGEDCLLPIGSKKVDRVQSEFTDTFKEVTGSSLSDPYSQQAYLADQANQKMIMDALDQQRKERELKKLKSQMEKLNTISEIQQDMVINKAKTSMQINNKMQQLLIGG